MENRNHISRHRLEMVVIYGMDGWIEKVYWQWREGRCTVNGTSTSAERAVTDARVAFEEWTATLAPSGAVME